MGQRTDILLAQGEPTARTALACALAAAGYSVAEAASGEECLRLAAALQPPVVVLDEGLATGGVQRVLRAQRSAGDLLCAMMVAAPPSEANGGAFADLVDAWLVRPFGAIELLAVVRLLLRAHGAGQREGGGPGPDERLYQDIVQSAIDGFWIIRASDLRFLEVNEAYCRLSGYSRGELLTMGVRDVEALERPEETAARREGVLARGFDRFETRHRRKDGTICDVEVSVRAIAREKQLMVAFVRDITEVRQAEATLRRSEARYRALLDAIPDRVFRHDAEGRFTDYHAPRDASIIMSPAAFLGKHYSEVVPPAISEPFAAAVARARATGLPQRFEYDLAAPDGTMHAFESRLGVGEDNDIVTIVRDITERRRAEQRLQAQHEQFLTILDAFPAILYVVDPITDEVLFVNKTTEKLFGRNPIGGICYREFQGREERCPFCTNEIILRTRKPYTWEYHNPVLNVDLLITDQIIRWPDGRDVRLELAVDITARKRAEAAQERLSKELARKNRELEQIVYVASHDLRSPLINIQGFGRELQAALAELGQVLAALDLPAPQRAQIDRLSDEDIPEALGYILAGVRKMDSLLKGLLRLSRLGRAALSVVPLDIGRLVAETIATFDFQIEHQGVKVEVGPLPGCCGDVIQIGQVFANLLGNALKYLDPGRPGVITITGERAEGTVIYCVADNGKGIAVEHHAKIFELYHRLDPAGSEGDGLGLTIVRTIVDRHGGWVRVASTPGVGSRFFIALPAEV